LPCAPPPPRAARGFPPNPARHAVEVVLLPEEYPGRLRVDQTLQLGPRLEPLLGVHDRHRLRDLVLDDLVAAVRGVRRLGLEELVDRVLRVEGRPPAQE